MKSKIYFVIVLTILGLYSCQQSEQVIDRYAHIEDVKARALIKKSIEHAGGVDTWENIKDLSYTKKFSLLLADGSVEKAFDQMHEYQYDPTIIDIKSTENGELIHTLYKDNNYSRTKDGTKLEVDAKALEKAVNTSTYVVSMPFKLLDSGLDITYEGATTLENGSEVEAIKVVYNPEQHANHSTADTWRYYFDQSDGKIVANWVDAGDHANIIENLTFERVGGILFNKERKSYRLDSLGKKEFLRADYYYNNYTVKSK